MGLRAALVTLVGADRVLAIRAAAGARRSPARSREMITDFEVGVLLPSAVESSGTSGLVSG